MGGIKTQEGNSCNIFYNMKFNPDKHHRRSIRLKGYDYSSVTSKINQLRGTPKQAVWQRNYFDRIIRNDKKLNRIREYIIENPMKWGLDKENPNN